MLGEESACHHLTYGVRNMMQTGKIELNDDITGQLRRIADELHESNQIAMILNNILGGRQDHIADTSKMVGKPELAVNEHTAPLEEAHAEGRKPSVATGNEAIDIDWDAVNPYLKKILDGKIDRIAELEREVKEARKYSAVIRGCDCWFENDLEMRACVSAVEGIVEELQRTRDERDEAIKERDGYIQHLKKHGEDDLDAVTKDRDEWKRKYDAQYKLTASSDKERDQARNERDRARIQCEEKKQEVRKLNLALEEATGGLTEQLKRVETERDEWRRKFHELEANKVGERIDRAEATDDEGNSLEDKIVFWRDKFYEAEKERDLYATQSTDRSAKIGELKTELEAALERAKQYALESDESKALQQSMERQRDEGYKLAERYKKERDKAIEQREEWKDAAEAASGTVDGLTAVRGRFPRKAPDHPAVSEGEAHQAYLDQHLPQGTIADPNDIWEKGKSFYRHNICWWKRKKYRANMDIDNAIFTPDHNTETWECLTKPVLTDKIDGDIPEWKSGEWVNKGNLRKVSKYGCEYYYEACFDHTTADELSPGKSKSHWKAVNPDHLPKVFDNG